MKKCITHNTQTLKTVWQYPERKGAGGWWRWAQRGKWGQKETAWGDGHTMQCAEDVCTLET